MADAIGADDVVYQTLPDLIDAIVNSAIDAERKVDEFEVGVFNGKYITPLDEGYLDHLEELKNKRIAQANNVGKRGADRTLRKESQGGIDAIQGRDIALHNINDQDGS